MGSARKCRFSVNARRGVSLEFNTQKNRIDILDTRYNTEGMIGLKHPFALSHYEQELLNGWEEVFKRGQLTLWIMLALRDGPKHMAAIKLFISNATKESLKADDQSMYRALRRYHETDLVNFTAEARTNAPDRKIYGLTNTGQRVLDAFVRRNLTHLVHHSLIKSITEAKS